jgi:hypothetical protein
VRGFLREFGGLSISFPHHKVPDLVDDCHFDACHAASGVFPDRVAKWAGQVDEPLCVIGEAFRNHMTLVMGQSGAVFAGMDDLLLKIGDSGTDAIEGLCTGRAFQEISRND